MTHDLDPEQRLAHLEAQVELLTRVLGEKVPAGNKEAEHAIVMAEAVQALAPLQAFLDDETVTDILINSAGSIYVESSGKLQLTGLRLPSDSKVLVLAEAIAAQAGRRIRAGRPLLDARLPDGSRVNIIAPPLAVDGTAISIRKFSKHAITLDMMAKQGNVSPALADFLKICARCRLNIVVAGGTGSGKTTLLNALSEHIDNDERIITIEDAAELRLRQPHVVRLETRPGLDGAREDEVSTRDLVRNALRMRPDRIIVGEVRGPEAFDMLQAMNTGHEGSLTTVHANHPRDALARMENMINMTSLNLPSTAIRNQIAASVHLIVQTSRMRDGQRRVTYVSEVVGMESDVVTMQELFAFQSRGEDGDGRLIGEFKWSGIMPRFLRRVAYYGEADRMSRALGVKLPKI